MLNANSAPCVFLRQRLGRRKDIFTKIHQRDAPFIHLAFNDSSFQ